MPLELYKRRHSRECLAEIERRSAGGKLTRPSDLAHFKGCACAWWVRGTNDYGVAVPRQSTKAHSWEAACAALQRFNLPPRAPEATPVTVDWALDHWMTHVVRVDLSPSTQGIYERSVKSLICFLHERRLSTLREVTSALVLELRAGWIGQGLRRTSINLYRAHLQTFFRYALSQGWIEENPLARVPSLKKQRRRDEDEETCTLPLDDRGDSNWQRVRAALEPYLKAHPGYAVSASSIVRHPRNFRALLELMYHTGLRISDAIRFKPDRMLETAFGASYTTRQVKTGDPVTVYLEAWLRDMLGALPRLSSQGHVFYNGAPRVAVYIDVQVRTPLRKLGVELGFEHTLRPHRFRDSFAINKLNQGVALADVSKLLGHRSVATTQKHYMPDTEQGRIALEQRLYSAMAAAQPETPANVVEIRKAS